MTESDLQFRKGYLGGHLEHGLLRSHIKNQILQEIKH